MLKMTMIEEPWARCYEYCLTYTKKVRGSSPFAKHPVRFAPLTYPHPWGIKLYHHDGLIIDDGKDLGSGGTFEK
jgi:hypothetical protein